MIKTENSKNRQDNMEGFDESPFTGLTRKALRTQDPSI